MPEMLNLLGCNKENFKKLLKNMSYTVLERKNEVFFRYSPKKIYKKPNKRIINENAFGVLKDLNFN